MVKRETWWCCGIEHDIEDSCSCGDRYEAPITPAINEFQGGYRFLSNFYRSYIKYQDVLYSSVEHFFQAMKSTNSYYRTCVAAASSAGRAKKLGRNVNLRPDWENIKLDVMEYGLREKFQKGTSLRNQLLATYPRKLIEGNYWNDKFWGVCLKTGEGRNELGKLLMKLRLEFINER